jgi:tight adherence protein B
LIIFISLLFSVIIGMLAFFILEPVAGGARAATDNALDKANTSLADMFMFIDLSRLVKLSFALIFMTTIVLYLITESFILPVIVAILISFLPTLLLKVLKQRRLEQIQNNIPDLLLNTSSALKAGSGLNQAIELAATEQGGAFSQ